MGFSKMIELLQKKAHGKIVFCNVGNFYIAVGKDAVLLNKILDLKVSCFKTEVCKIGFPINSLEKYIEKLHEKKYGYIVYYFDRKKEELEIVIENEGKYRNLFEVEKNNCYLCKKGLNGYKKADKYIQAVAKLYESEEKIEEE